MKQKKFETVLYSAVGVAVMFVAIVAFNLIASTVRGRVDATEDKLYTLSDGTRAILKKLDSTVEIRFYFSESQPRVRSDVRNYARQVEDLLEEFTEASGGKLRVRKIDPKPDTEAEEMAQADGIEPQPVEQLSPETFYLGLAVSLDPQKAALPLLSQDRERLLEYDLARAIGRVIATNKPVVGVMTSLPMFGQPMNPMMMRMGQQGGQRPWIFISELQRDYDVRQIQMDVDKIEDAVQVLIVAHPKEISDKAQYAIDQFVLRGGKLLALLDGMSVVDRPQQPNNPMAGMLPGGGSSLPKLLQAWGLAFDTTKVVADLNFTRELAFQRGQRPQAMPTWLFVNPDGINTKDVITAQLDNLLLPAAGGFSGKPVTGIEQTVLLHTTKKSELVDGMTAQFSGQKIVDDFKASGNEFPLAVRLKGKFKTAFPEGKPAAEKADGADDKKVEAKADAGDSLKESKTEGVVVLIGDTDFLYDNFCVDVNPLFGMATPINGNLGFAQNVIEQLAGDESLIGTRSRGALRRPFTVVQSMQAQAEENYRGKIQKLNEELQNTQQQLNELQAKKEPGQKLILSPEQQAKIAEFQNNKRKAERELRELRKNLRQDIDSLENRLKWVNIAGMPLLVVVAGIGVAVARKQRTKAK